MSKYAPPMVETTSLLSQPPPQAALVDTKVKREGFTTPPDSDVKLEPTSTTLTPSLQNLNLKMGVTTPKLDDSSLCPSLPDSKRDSSNSPPASDTKLVRKGALLIGELPRAETEARQTFTEIFDNQYQYGTLGRSREALESMTCDCQYEHGVDDPVDACGHGSNCINRLTQVECMPDDCRCRNYCQNQRFQRKQYGALDIVKTEKKGFGLRAAASMQKDTFVYEYVGEVVNTPSFKKRMRDYASEGIQHFYFMMLQKDEFIDATKRGGIGRFANHSCNPNCYVAKWTVGQYVRMGIFAARNIAEDEELTFNYNVDRYGHDAQPCYCGEAQCLGFIGGKTQTDIGAMDDLYLDALGIADEVESLGLKGNKKKKSKKLDEDWIPVLKPMLEKDVPKVVQAVRQTQSRKVLFKLLTRIKITEDHAALRQLMRLRGFSLMTNILEDYVKDNEIITLALECLTTWPLLQRNKVDDSKIVVPVEACALSENDFIKGLAQKLLEHWDTLESGYRIPKRLKQDGVDEEHTILPIIPSETDNAEGRPSKRSRYNELYEQNTLGIKPLGFSSHAARHKELVPVQSIQKVEIPTPPTTRQPTRQDIQQIIIAASVAAAKAPPLPNEDGANGLSSTGTPSKAKRALTREEREANKEKRLLKLVGAVVVKCMSKYSKQMEHDMFKKHAKELTQIIAEKEKKSASYKEGRLDALSEEKVAKIKKFAKEYIAKILRKLEKSGEQRDKHVASSSISTGTTVISTMTDTPNSNSDDVIMTEMPVEEPMDLGIDAGYEDDAGMSGGDDQPDEEGKLPPEGNLSPRDPMDLFSAPTLTTEPCDPRLRPPNHRPVVAIGLGHNPEWEGDQDELDFLTKPEDSPLEPRRPRSIEATVATHSR